MKPWLAAAMGIGLASAAPAAAGPSCPPAAALAGDPEVVSDVALQLAVLGVGQPTAGCPAVRAEVNRDGARLAVALADPAGRRAVRNVSDPRIAAAWIETWLRPEIGAPLLTERAAPAGTAPVVAARAGIAASPEAATPGAGWRIAVAAERHYGDDDSTWRAVSAAVCVELGPLCTGLAAHLGDSRGYTLNRGLTTSDRLAADGVAFVSLPVTLERISLSPSVGIGLAWVKTSPAGGDVFSSCPMPDGTLCKSELEGFTRSSLGPRLEVGGSAEFPITDHLRLVIAAGLSWAPMAPTEVARPSWFDERAPDPNAMPGDPAMTGDPDLVDPDLIYALPGEPSRYVRLGVGLELELP